jgi:nucleotide sugar dehydrogenase
VNITVVALGKIGLPLAVQFATKGHRVRGADVNPAVVEQVNAGSEPFPGEHGLAETLMAVVESGHLTATTDTSAAVADSDVVVVVVPLFVDQESRPDFDWMDNATKAIGEGLRTGTLVVYETTLPVGTTRTRFGPALEKHSGLAMGKDFFLAFSPERVLTGRIFADLRRYPKLIGGVDQGSTAKVREFYEAVLDFDDRPDLGRPNGVWDLGSAEAAELAKLAETTYRDVNIGLANQFARFAEKNGIDVHSVIEASNSQPYSHIHRPGVAVGGHCIPVYPRLYLWNDPDATVVSSAREMNASVPARAVMDLAATVGGLSGKRVAVLGAAYRGGVKETAFSGAFALVEQIAQAGGSPVVHDPLYADDELAALGFDPYRLGEPVDAVILHTDHAEYRDLTQGNFPGVQAVLDGRGVLQRQLWPSVSWHVLGVG